MYHGLFCVALVLMFYPVEAGAVYCRAVGVPKGCVAAPAAGVGAGAPGLVAGCSRALVSPQALGLARRAWG